MDHSTRECVTITHKTLNFIDDAVVEGERERVSAFAGFPF